MGRAHPLTNKRPALDHARAGRAVFPCRPDNKQPYTAHGFHDASTDESTVAAWWDKWPHALIGWALPAGVVVVDRDSTDDRADGFDPGELPESTTVRTGGGGRHLYYATDGRAVAQNVRIRPNTDLRVGGKGYVIVPPSVSEKGLYELVAGSLDGPFPPLPEWAYQGRERRRLAEVELEYESIPAGERNTSLTSWAGRLRAQGLHPNEIHAALAKMNELRCDPPLPVTEVARIALSSATWDAAPHRFARSGPPEDLGALLRRLGARLLADVPRDPPPPLLLDRLDPLGHTILFGTGGIGKGLLAASWIARVTREGRRVLILDYEDHNEEWARRVEGLGGDRSNAIVVSPLSARWDGVRGALWLQAQDIRALAIAFGVDLLVIDSIVPACGGSDALKPEAASLYAGALVLIGGPVLSLAHVTKADDLRYPFGSVFWHNLARTTWSLAASGDRIDLVHRKHNNYARLGRFTVTAQWMDGVPTSVVEEGASTALADRAYDVLVEERAGLTVKEIAALLGADGEVINFGTLKKAMQRHGRLQSSGGNPARWTIIAKGDQEP